MPNWTDEQKMAIDSRDGSILVSAAAGSGKTAVLVERIIQRLSDPEKPCPADRLLIVTFTKAATAQMHDRIYKALRAKSEENPEDGFLKQQLMLLPYAKISTIDSFCNTLVKDNFQKLNLSPDYRLCEGAELEIMYNDALTETLETLYSAGDEEFNGLAGMLSNGADDSKLSELIKSIQINSKAHRDPVDWLESLCSEYDNYTCVKDSCWGTIILGRTKELLRHCQVLWDKMKKMSLDDSTVEKYYGKCIGETEKALRVLNDTVEKGGWDEIKNAVESFSLPQIGRLPKGYSSPQASMAQGAKNKISGVIKNNIIPLFCSTEEESRADVEKLRGSARAIVKAVEMFDEVFSEKKRTADCVDFSDVTHMTLKLLMEKDENGNFVKTPLARTLSENFEEILVDEYQDINEIQDSIFSAISRDDSNIFRVGDVKQSIYGFRQAMPEIFLRKRDTLDYYRDGNYPAKIILGKNFRSRTGVTENVNFIFEQIMSRRVGDVDYNSDERLSAAASYEECDFYQTELHILSPADGRTRVNRHDESLYVAELVEDIVNSGILIKGENDAYRRVSYRDICILMRSTSGNKAALYANAMAARNIPSFVATRGGFFICEEVSIMTDLLRIIDNPLQDIPLLAVLLSPLFGFNADELASMRIETRKGNLYRCLCAAAKSGNEKAEAFLAELAKFRTMSQTVSVAELTEQLYDLTGCRAVAFASGESGSANANLTLLVEYAAEYEKNGGRCLSGFIRYLDKMKKQDKDFEAASDVSETADVVKIMTVHKSKGLEFPVCIAVDLSKSFRHDNASSVTFHPDYGLAFEVRDSRMKCKYPSLGKKALLIADDDDMMSEEMRILYVAMTRAKEKLICVCRYDDIGKKMCDFADEMTGSAKISPNLVRLKNCCSDWIVAALMRHPDASALRFRAGITDMDNLPCEERLLVKECFPPEETEVREKESKVSRDYPEELAGMVKERLDYVYPYLSLSSLRSKVSPSDFESQNDGISVNLNYLASQKPSFLSKLGLNSARKGTATHKFMERYDYADTVSDIETRIEQMTAAGYLSADEAAVLERGKLKAFFETETAGKIRSSSMLLREKKVSILINAGELWQGLDGETAAEKILVQGYVDCAFEENGELVIVDYKTDRNVTSDELRERYERQLKLYERALSECLGMKVAKTLIYSFDSNTFTELI